MLADGKEFDYILVDGFDKNANAGVLDTLPFYQACRARLSSNGLLAVNLLGHKQGYQASAARIDKAFDGRSLVFPSCNSGNTIAFATASEKVDVELDELRSRAEHLKRETSLNLLPTLTRIKQAALMPLGRLEI
jgi:spermidine synthase